jgi:hypothetical protein
MLPKASPFNQEEIFLFEKVLGEFVESPKHNKHVTKDSFLWILATRMSARRVQAYRDYYFTEHEIAQYLQEVRQSIDDYFTESFRPFLSRCWR